MPKNLQLLTFKLFLLHLKDLNNVFYITDKDSEAWVTIKYGATRTCQQTHCSH